MIFTLLMSENCEVAEKPQEAEASEMLLDERQQVLQSSRYLYFHIVNENYQLKVYRLYSDTRYANSTRLFSNVQST